MPGNLFIPPFDLESPFLRAALNERWTRVWSYWRPGEYPADAAEKTDVEQRVEMIMRENGPAAIATFARRTACCRTA
jgi:hypothetical protein